MAIDERLLEILCCPVSKVAVRPMASEEVDRLNAAIDAGGVLYRDGSAVSERVAEGLITEDRATVYVIVDEIPVMLVEKGIPTEQLEGF
jgi:uncharacterized protein YbaR (Trm112 family)